MLRSSKKIAVENAIAKYLKIDAILINFTDSRLLGEHDGIQHLMICADSTWFDVTIEGSSIDICLSE
jgi:hypothetical protein